MTTASTNWQTTADATQLAPLHVVVPMRTVSGGKARLGGALDAEEREELVLGMLRHTLDVLSRWHACDRIHVISPDPTLLAAATAALADVARPTLQTTEQADEGLNEAIELAISAARVGAASSLLVLPSDLPDLSLEALDELLLAADAAQAAAAGGSIVTIVPSDARGGTNALLLKPVDIIKPAFGEGSFEAHLRAANAAEAAVQVVAESALGFDLDTPDDLDLLPPARLRELMELGREDDASSTP